MLKIFFSRRSPKTEHQINISQFLSDAFGIRTRSIELYETALTHKSFFANTTSKMQNNERLEFLGDSVLNTIVTHILYEKFPQKTEGELTQLRSRIVSRENLNMIGKSIGLEPFILYQKSKNEYLSLIGNAFESFIAAIYLDKGYKKVYSILEQKILDLHLDYEAIETKNEDYKSQLIVYCQKTKSKLQFQVDEEINVEGRIKFVISVLIDEQQKATAEAFSKRKAEQLASEIVLKSLI
jgi:ribonuclease-3